MQAQLSQDSGTEASPAGVQEETEPIPGRVQGGSENAAIPFSIFKRLMQTQNEAFLQMLERINKDNEDRNHPAPYSKRARPKDPRIYKGESLGELRGWKVDIETYFDNVDPQEYPTGAEKVKCLRQYLGDNQRNLWDAHFRNLSGREADTIRPEDVYEFLKSLWGSDRNLAIKEARLYENAQQ